MSCRDNAGKSIKCGIIHVIDPDTSTMANWEIDDQFQHCHVCSGKTADPSSKDRKVKCVGPIPKL